MAEDSNSPTVHQVGASFVSRYYKTLAKEPLILYKFYKDVSHLTHGVEGENPLVAHGQNDIKNKIEKLGYQDCKVKLSVVDCQKSQDGSVVVVVQGYLSNKGSAPRRFTQTFVLAVQPKGYYVYNDVFRYLSNEIPLSAYAGRGAGGSSTEVSNTDANGSSNNEHFEVDSTSATVGTVDESVGGEDRSISDVDVPEDSHSSSGESPSDEPKESETLAPSEAPKGVPADQFGEMEQEEPTSSDGPRTFASIVAGPGYQPPQPQQQEKEQSQQKEKISKQIHRKNDRKDDRRSRKQSKERKDGNRDDRNESRSNKFHYSVFVKNLKHETTEEDLRQVFNKFGDILNVENKAQEKGFAFITFRSLDAMKAALDSNVPVLGQNTFVQKRKRGGRGRGRLYKTYKQKQPNQ
eukprot:gb/GECH01008660.1/.p1 GENE.gb/GECH01008660.1/~~gb/GECH01008660.1/.p1  ORF type:complete len:406 (+),score=111.25 gb/GECH01008660.1/:1-1218(+)